MAKAPSRRIPEVDVYIAKSPVYARPILAHLRDLFHQASPSISEEIKWGCPHFVQRGIVGSFAAFKHHVGFGFWKSKLMQDPAGLFGNEPKASMCTSKFSSLEELPSDKILLSYIREAIALNENEVKLPAAKKSRPPLKTPPYLIRALKSNPPAAAAFAKLAPSHRRDYIEWLVEAKTEATREKRLATTLQWLVEGKRRNWKYERTATGGASQRNRSTTRPAKPIKQPAKRNSHT